jgi:hypothetical protein
MRLLRATVRRRAESRTETTRSVASRDGSGRGAHLCSAARSARCCGRGAIVPSDAASPPTAPFSPDDAPIVTSARSNHAVPAPTLPAPPAHLPDVTLVAAADRVIGCLGSVLPESVPEHGSRRLRSSGLVRQKGRVVARATARTRSSFRRRPGCPDSSVCAVARMGGRGPDRAGIAPRRAAIGTPRASRALVCDPGTGPSLREASRSLRARRRRMTGVPSSPDRTPHVPPSPASTPLAGCRIQARA